MEQQTGLVHASLGRLAQGVGEVEGGQKGGFLGGGGRLMVGVGQEGVGTALAPEARV